VSPIRKILVPVDFSDSSTPVLERAAALARGLGAEVDVLHGWDTPESLPPDVQTSETTFGVQSLAGLIEQSSAEHLREFVENAKQRGIAVTHSFSKSGPPAHVIVEAARTGHYDLIVMGTHGRSGLTRVMLGSVAEKVVRHAICPVLTVRGTEAAGAAVPARILVGLDFSAFSEIALARAAELASALGATLDPVHVWDRPALSPSELMVQRENDVRTSVGELIREGAEREMRGFMDAFNRDGRAVDVPSPRLLLGEPASALLGELEKGAHDLVVVGTRGRTSLKHLLLGSVAEKLLRLSPVPVLTVPLA
jgi:nucleotide-binding universal stress UspA family protein